MMNDKKVKPEKKKISNRAAIKEVNKLITDKKKKESEFMFEAWIPKNSGLKIPVRFYIYNSPDKDFIAKYNHKLIISSASKSQQLKIENYLLDNDIDIPSMKSMGELSELLNARGLLIKNRKREQKKSNPKKLGDKKLSKLKKGDKLHIQHFDKEIVISITHIEMEKGSPSVNFSCSGDDEIHISTEFKGRASDNKKGRLQGSNKGRGWSKGNQGVKK